MSEKVEVKVKETTECPYCHQPMEGKKLTPQETQAFEIFVDACWFWDGAETDDLLRHFFQPIKECMPSLEIWHQFYAKWKLYVADKITHVCDDGWVEGEAEDEAQRKEDAIYWKEDQEKKKQALIALSAL